MIISILKRSDVHYLTSYSNNSARVCYSEIRYNETKVCKLKFLFRPIQSF